MTSTDLLHGHIDDLDGGCALGIHDERFERDAGDVPQHADAQHLQAAAVLADPLQGVVTQCR